MSLSNPIGIHSLGHVLPNNVVANQHFVDIGLDTTPEWIESRTGIQKRNIETTNQTSDLATAAARHAIEQSSITIDQIDFIIVATASPDHHGFPATACIVQQKLGCKRPIPCFDITAACSGFAYGLTLAYSKIKAGLATYGLVIGAERLNTLLDWSDRRSAILFGDGAGAAVVGPLNSGGFLAFNEGADGHHADILKCQPKSKTMDFNGKMHDTPRELIQMDGQAVFKTGVNVVVNSIEALFKSTDIKINDVTYFACHQANQRILESVAKKLKIPIEKFLINIDQVGNTSAASIPLLLSQHMAKMPFNKGDLICMVGFGAGFTWSSILLEWS